MRALALLLATLPALVSADGLQDYRDKLKKLEQEEGVRRSALAKHCESVKMWKEAAAEYERLVKIAPEDADIAEKAAKAKERADVTTSRPAKADEAAYRQGAALLGRDMAKKYWEVAEFAKRLGLFLEAEDAGEVAAWMDAAAGAADKRAKFYEDLYPKDDPRRLATEALNRYREACRLPPVMLSPRLSDGAEKHAKYLVTNRNHPTAQGLGGHDEHPELPGFTPEGQKAGGASDIGFTEPVSSMVAMLGTFYHRIPLLDPALRRIGIGSALYSQEEGRGPVVIDCLQGVDRSKRPDCPMVIAYPAQGQKDVQRAFDDEIPDPIPDAPDRDNGTAITLTWFVKAKIADAVMTVTCNGQPVEGWFSSPARPARKDRGNGQSLCFIPFEVFPAEAKVAVSVTATVDGKPFAMKWDFRTGSRLSDSMGR